MSKEINTHCKQHSLNIEGIYDTGSKSFKKMTIKEFEKAEKNDRISHFICRLAYSRNEELKKWFAI